jgi:hypothetical protein
MRKRKQPPAGFVWLSDLADEFAPSISGVALRVRAQAAEREGNPHYRRLGDSEKSPWMVSESEAVRLRGIYLPEPVGASA